MQKQMIQIQTDDGNVAVEAYRIRDRFYAHRGVGENREGWFVSHVPSGTALVLISFDKRHQAVAFCESLLERVPELEDLSTKEEIDAFSKDHNEKMTEAMRRAIWDGVWGRAARNER